MYTAFYNLKAKPFQISSDPAFIWLGEKHKEALATLRYGVLDNKGFLLLTGDVGTGKTTLINTLIASLGNDVIYASVPDPRLEKLDFFNYIAVSFGIEGECTSKGKFLIKFSTFLHDAYKKNKKVLLIIDESQLLTQDALEEIRLLSNIEIPDSHLLNIFFVGQNEFNEIITRPENRAVAQRLTLNYYIEPLSLEETEKYIQHRLKIAGTTEKLFHAPAIKEIYTYAEGFPRRINIICDHCLLTGYVKEKKTIDGSIVQDCARELRIPEYKKKKPQAPRPDRLEQPVPVPLVSPELPAIKPPVETQNFRPFRAISTFILLVFVLVIISLIFPDFFTKTYNNAIDYFTLAQNRLGMNTSAPSSDGTRTGLHDKTEPSQQQNKEIPPPAPPTPLPKEVPSPAQNQLQKSEKPELIPRQGTGSRFPKAAMVEPIADKAQPDASAQPASTKTTARPDDEPQTVPLALPKETLVIRFVHDSNFFNAQDISGLRKFAEIMKSHPQAVVSISGYTDSSGNEGYNAKLSEFRANIVKSFLLGQGLPARQIKTQGLGVQNPIDRNDTEEGRRLNRRVEIKVISQ